MNKFTSTTQWQSGSRVADFLDALYRGQDWRITPTTPYEERVQCLGDRHYRRDGQHLLIEYKSGMQTAETGNVFLETVSVDSANKPGWVYTCKADYIFYAALANHKILLWRPRELRAVIETLKTQFKTAKTRKHQNAGYNTHGVIVPLAEAERLFTCKVVQLEPRTKGRTAFRFVQQLYAAPIPRVAIENPRGLLLKWWRFSDQTIQPYKFGDPMTKETHLWLRGLPPLMYTLICTDVFVNWTEFGHRSQKDRSRTFPGIAAAMANQWGAL